MEQFHDLQRWSRQFGVDLSLKQLEQFDIYLSELRFWKNKTNLTSLTDPKVILIKHFVDSIACGRAMGHLDHGESLLDIGSGAGFPGLPLKLVYPDLNVTLLEPSSKKTAFLRHIIGTLQLENVRAVPKRLEDFTLEPQKFSYIIARALNMTLLVQYCPALLADGGRILLCRSEPLQTKVPGFHLETELSYELPERSGKRVVSVLISG